MVTRSLLVAVQSQWKMGRGSEYQNLYLKQQSVTINDAYTYSFSACVWVRVIEG